MKKSKVNLKRPIKLRKRTEELLNKNPAVIKKISPMDLRNLLEDLQIYQIELEKYNNELRKIHKQLRESEEKYHHLSEGTFEAVVWHDKGKIIEANEQYYELFGHTTASKVPSDKHNPKSDYLNYIYHQNKKGKT